MKCKITQLNSKDLFWKAISVTLSFWQNVAFSTCLLNFFIQKGFNLMRRIGPLNDSKAFSNENIISWLNNIDSKLTFAKKPPTIKTRFSEKWVILSKEIFQWRRSFFSARLSEKVTPSVINCFQASQCDAKCDG